MWLLAVIASAKDGVTGDVVCTARNAYWPYHADAWRHADNPCDKEAVFEGRGGRIRVFYDDEVQGFGLQLVDAMLEAVAEFGVPGAGPRDAARSAPRFAHGLEWCAGAGFLGFAVKAQGLIKRLSLTEINPRAVKCLHKTVAENRLAREVDLAALQRPI